MATAIVVKLELGHTAKIRDVPTLSGHTHDWMVFVKGAEGMVIEHFIDKVVFWLHETFDPPKHTVKFPPYELRQTGYAGFNIPIDIYFKNKSDPKTVRFDYDMFLHMESMPPVNHTRIEMLTFTNPSADFMEKLIKAGGIVKAPVTQGPTKERKHVKDSHQMDDGKSRKSLKEKHENPKIAHKSHKSDGKASKHARSEEKRRNSVGDGDRSKKKKSEEKIQAPPLPQSNEARQKEKDKINKVKIKMEKSSQPSLFSREESIDIKQIKKKETSKKDDRKDREKRPDVKPKKEHNEKREKLEKRKKENRFTETKAL